MNLSKIKGPFFFDRMTKDGDSTGCYRTYSDGRRLGQILRRNGFRWRGPWGGVSMFDGMASFGWRRSRAIWIQRQTGPEFAGRIYVKDLPPTEERDVRFRQSEAARAVLANWDSSPVDLLSKGGGV